MANIRPTRSCTLNKKSSTAIKPTIVKIETLNTFKTSLFDYESELDKAISDVTSIETKSYLDKFYETRRKIQLTCELQIAQIKASNEFDINVDDCVLPSNLQVEIEMIQSRSQLLIDRSDLLEKELDKTFILNESNRTEYSNELKSKKAMIIIWKKYLENHTNNIREKFINKVKKELNNFDVDYLRNKTKKLTLNNYNITFNATTFFKNFKETIDNIQLGFIRQRQSVNLANMQLIDSSQIVVDGSAISYRKKIGILENGNYFISFGKNLIIYDPIQDKIIKRESFKKNVNQIKVYKDKVLIKSVDDYINCRIRHFTLMDANFNIKEEKEIKLKTDSLEIVGVNDTCFYCTSSNEILKCYDWSLNEIEIDIKFQDDDVEKPFYVPFRKDSKVFRYNIIQFEKTNDSYISLVQSKDVDNYFSFYNKEGILIKQILTGHKMQIIPNCNLVVVSSYLFNNLKYFDLNGQLIQEDIFELPTLKSNNGYFFVDVIFDSQNKIHIFKRSTLTLLDNFNK